MLKLQIDETEEQLLAETLDISLSRLTDEISHTDSRDYRDFLKKRREVLERLRCKLP